MSANNRETTPHPMRDLFRTSDKLELSDILAQLADLNRKVDSLLEELAPRTSPFITGREAEKLFNQLQGRK